MADPSHSPPQLTPQQRNQHIERLRQLAQSPGLSPEQRAEALRHANNLLAAGRIRQRLAQRNQHPAHPTRQ